MLVTAAVRAAYREGQVKAVGTVVTDDEMAEGVERLNAFWLSLWGAELGEKLADWPIPTIQRAAPNSADPVHLPWPQALDPSLQPRDIAAKTGGSYPQFPQNTRVLWGGSTIVTAYFPERPDPGSRVAVVDVGATAPLQLSGNGRLIMLDGSPATGITFVHGTAPVEWYYREDLGRWLQLEELTAESSLPLPREFDDLFVTALAIRLSALNGSEPRSGTTQAYGRLLKQAQQRFRQSQNTIGGGNDLRGSEQTIDNLLIGGGL